MGLLFTFVFLSTLAALLLLSPIILRQLADIKLFFARGNEGEFKAVVRNGAYRKGVPIYQGMTIDDEGTVIEQEKNIVIEPFKKLWERFIGGVFPLWIPTVDEIFQYNFRWVNLWKIKPKGDEDGLVSSAELPNGQFAVSFEKKIDYIFLKDQNQFFLLKDAETATSLISASIYTVITLRILNPYKALFRVDKWLDVTLIAIESSLRSWVSRTSYEDVIKKKEVLEHQQDSEFLQSLTTRGESLTSYLLSRYGVQVKRIQFIEVELPKDFTDAATKQAAADREAVTIQTLAEARAGQIAKTYDAIIERGEPGLAIRAFESLDKAGESPSNWIITAGPGLADSLTKLAAGIRFPEPKAKPEVPTTGGKP